MSAAFGFLSFIAFIAMIIGLIKPAWLKMPARSKVLMWYGGAFAILFAIGIAIPNNPQQNQPTAQSVAQAPDQAAPSTPSTTPVEQVVAPAPTPKPTPVATPTPAPQPTPAPAPVQPQTVMSLSGSGSKSTQIFTVGNSWQMNWSYDCSNFGDQGNFQVFIYTSDGSMSFDNAPVNEEGMSGSDIEYYHTGGSYYIEVNSECNWKVTVQD